MLWFSTFAHSLGIECNTKSSTLTESFNKLWLSLDRFAVLPSFRALQAQHMYQMPL